MLRFLAVSGQIAWKALGRNRLRSGLTTLGVVIGVAAVIAMVALGNGARASVERTLKTAGTSIVQVSAGNFTKGGESMNIAAGLGSATTLTREAFGAQTAKRVPGTPSRSQGAAPSASNGRSRRSCIRCSASVTRRCIGSRRGLGRRT